MRAQSDARFPMKGEHIEASHISEERSALIENYVNQSIEEDRDMIKSAIHEN